VQVGIIRRTRKFDGARLRTMLYQTANAILNADPVSRRGPEVTTSVGTMTRDGPREVPVAACKDTWWARQGLNL
jgi:hypothetical protein